ncbi:putative nicotinic acetylcholine receptor alpha 10-like [Homarus americanus]|uniref:Putative nicotinic acetylcholine receptor alpha 10-like n=1 Tax=Homarus americanus TaxID=6706 RepID=A0A8J5N838_HOMAM|nr:putative nicotinic acetylcholine receptor alpha 10-like [Homarus americanus]
MRGREVPSFVKKVVFSYMAKMMCIRLDIPDPMGGQGHKFTNMNHQGEGYPGYREFGPSHLEMSDRLLDPEVKCENGGIPPSRLTGGVHSQHSTSCPAAHPCLDTFERHFIRVLNKVYQTIEKNEIRLAEQDRRDTIKLEWQQVALIPLVDFHHRYHQLHFWHHVYVTAHQALHHVVRHSPVHHQDTSPYSEVFQPIIKLFPML